LEQNPASQPHSASQSVSALRRLHADQHVITKSSTPFDPTTVKQSQTLHMDYTERLQAICTSGTQYLQIACWGHYINIQPLTSLRSAQTTQAFTNSVKFFRKLGVNLTQLRMNNQWSGDLRDVASGKGTRYHHRIHVHGSKTRKPRRKQKEPFELQKITL
jgi:hypothetical protein